MIGPLNQDASFDAVFGVGGDSDAYGHLHLLLLVGAGERMGLEDSASLIKDGRIKDAKTIIGILLAIDYLSKSFKIGQENKK